VVRAPDRHVAHDGGVEEARHGNAAGQGLAKPLVHRLERVLLDQPVRLTELVPLLGRAPARQFLDDAIDLAGLAALVQLVAEQRLGGEKPMVRHMPLSSGDRLIWNQDIAASPDLIHIVFALIYYFGEALTDGCSKSVKAVHFAHARPEGFRAFPQGRSNNDAIPCHFNRPSTYLEYHPFVMMMPTRRDNPAIVSAARKQKASFARSRFERENHTKLMYEYLLYLLDKSGLSLDGAAATFGMAERTLRRKLVAEGISYRQLLEQALERLHRVEDTLRSAAGRDVVSSQQAEKLRDGTDG